MSSLEACAGYIRTTLIFLAGFLFVLPVNLVASPETIIVRGNEKTDSEYLVQLTQKCIRYQAGDSSTDVSTNRLEECIMNSRLFSEVSVEKDNNQYTVTIGERWSLIPIPIITADSEGETSYGFFVYDSNFLGKGKTIALGGTTSDNNKMLFLMFEDPALFFSDWKLRTTVGNRESQVYLYDGEDEVDGLHENVRFYNFSLGYEFLPKLSSYLGIGHQSLEYESLEQYVKPEGFSATNLKLNVKWDNTAFKFYFQEGLSINGTLLKHVDRDDDRDLPELLNIETNWQIRLFEDHALQLGFGFITTNNADRITSPRIGSVNGARGVPNDGIWVEHFAALSLDYQIPVLSGQYGTWTVAPFIDHGVFTMVDAKDEQLEYTSCGLGTYFFLKQIAIPGLGLVIGTNDSYQETFGKFTIGMAF